ncbi:MAG TPA: preprotein translocase subunit SecE [Candidatus Microsaccharimonas sp.]|nr:preprotein translocase subunit SecE [Candidatus Microsaccharimonas sp.]
MADSKGTKDSELTPAITKRRLRAPTETVRQRAEKVQAAAANPTPTKKRLVWRGFTSPIRLVWRSITWLSHRPPLKQIGHGLRWFFARRPVKFLGRLLGLHYIASSFREVKLVTWPTFGQSMKLTRAVIIFSFIFGTLIAGVDYGLDKLFKQIIIK